MGAWAGKGGQLRRGSMLHCKAVAPKYGVTPKTIRDVWSGRSWAEVLAHERAFPGLETVRGPADG
jgi:hypothetical protein